MCYEMLPMSDASMVGWVDDRRGMQGPLQSVCSLSVSSNLMCLAHSSILLA